MRCSTLALLSIAAASACTGVLDDAAVLAMDDVIPGPAVVPSAPRELPMIVPEQDLSETDHACARGRRHAAVRLGRGELAIAVVGHPLGCRPELIERLHDELAIDMFPIAGCVVGEADLEYIRCFDAVMEPEIVRVHGPEAVPRVMAEVCGLGSTK